VPAPKNQAHAASAGRQFDAIYAEFFPFVWRCLRGLGVPEPLLDDTAQDVFVVVHRRLPEFAERSTVRTWLYAILRNVASNQRRSAARRRLAEPLEDELPSRAPGPHERAEEAEAAAFVQRFLCTVDAKRRDVFMLALLEEMSIPEVAAALSIPLNTAYTRLRLARVDFQKALAAERRT
jgi:RNA polymerase sigma-70 factor (ECF subfamily)